MYNIQSTVSVKAKKEQNQKLIYVRRISNMLEFKKKIDFSMQPKKLGFRAQLILMSLN